MPRTGPITGIRPAHRIGPASSPDPAAASSGAPAAAGAPFGRTPAVFVGHRPIPRSTLIAPTGRRRYVAPLAIGVVTAVAAVFGWLPRPSGAQQRPIPPGAKLGVLTIGVLPDATLDGKAIRLGPGVRIRNTDNLIVVPSTIRGTALAVAYTTGPLGEILEAWILSDAELARLRARRTGS